MTDREKLIDLLKKAKSSMWGQSGLSCELARNSYIAEYLLANGVRLELKQATSDKTSDENKRFATDNSVGDKWTPTEPLTNGQRWIPVTERLPEEFVSVLGHMTDAGDFPAVRECYMVGGAFFFPALCDVRPVDKWMPMPKEV